MVVAGTMNMVIIPPPFIYCSIFRGVTQRTIIIRALAISMEFVRGERMSFSARNPIK
jgi:hypothetical protein